MESKDELKEIDVRNCMCYYLDDIMKVTVIDFKDILFYKKSYKTWKYFDLYSFHTKLSWVQTDFVLHSKK